MKMRNKGKVHPTPSSSSPSSSFSSSSPSSSSSSSLSANNKDALSILKLLPAAILALASVLSLEDKEVLAYMITRSIKATNPSSILEEKTKKNTKKNGNNNNIAAAHKPPMFDCECFDCYTSYWCKWDSSPNRELIHQAIEAFEEHLSNGELSTKKGKNKKRDQKGRRGGEKVEENGSPENQESAQGSPENDVGSPEIAELASEDAGDAVMEVVGEVAPPETEVAMRSAAGGGGGGHKGLARKVLPDVLGLFNSRLWSLWSPNV